MVSLKINQREIIILVVLISITLIVTFYTISAHSVANRINEHEGILTWNYMPGGSFIPWPSHNTVGPLHLPMSGPISETDALYYQFFIKSYMLIVGTILLWTIVSWKIWKLWKQNQSDLR